MVSGQIRCIWLLLLLRRCPPGGAQVILNSDPAYKESIVFEHNRYRSQVTPPAADMLYMSWDEDLAKTAEAWARMCANYHNPFIQMPGMGHPTFSVLGENLWILNISSTGSASTDPQGSELDQCNYTQPHQPDKCLPLLQVVWAHTYKVGCGSALCKRVLGLPGHQKDCKRIVVCNYAPAGNVKGEKPYTEGPACSRCPAKDTCDKKLCRNAGRDAVAPSSWNPPWRCAPCRAGRQRASFYAALLTLASVSLYCVA